MPSRNSGGGSRASVTSLFSEDQSRKLLDAKMDRKRADEDYTMMQNRINRLRLEEERAHKNLEKTRGKADDIVRLKAQNELRARAKEHARKMQDEFLRRDMQAKSIERATRDASIRAGRQAQIRMKQRSVQDTRQEKLRLQQTTIEYRREQEQRAAKMKQDIYVRERQAVHDKYKAKHLAQMRAVQSYEERVVEEDRLRGEKEAALLDLEEEEAALLHRLRLTQELQRSAYDQLEVALQV